MGPPHLTWKALEPTRPDLAGFRELVACAGGRIVIAHMFRRRANKESPLRNKPAPARQAGESLSEWLDIHFITAFFFWAANVAAFWAMTFVQWSNWRAKTVPHPWFAVAFSSAVTAVAAVRIAFLLRRFRSVALGLYGERYAATVLDRLRGRPNGPFHILHDLPGPDFNVDHVLIGPEGVYAVETKHISRLTAGRSEDRQAAYDGHTLTVPGCRFDRDPLAQAEASAAYVRRILKETTGRDVPVRPVLLLVGWYVQQKAKRPRVWVLNENHLEAYLDHEPPTLAPEDVALYADRLARHEPR